ncbi:MAG TPA: HD domain-containing protein [Tissierellia bacterium]|nr:HD domain-containing protein [Tissierellia bacterium]
MTKTKLSIKLGQLISSLSLALDISENRYFGHSRRTAYIAYSIAVEMGLSEKEIIDIYYGALIHDIGMAGQMAEYTVKEIHFDNKLKKEHCELGGDIVSKLPLDREVIKYITYHHEEWNGDGVFGLKKDEIPLPAQIIHISDYFELFFLRKLEKSEGNPDIDTIKKWLDSSRDKNFKGELCDILLSIMEKEKFWLDLKFKNIRQVLDLIEPGKNTCIDMYGLKKISEAFSIIIDSKSPFTYRHSQGISNLTRKFAIYLGYSPRMIEKLEIAANLHDLGKLTVPNDILEKPGKLTKDEFRIIKSHPYYTKLILKQVEGLEDIAEWAGNHHEKLNGKGYPEKLNYETLTREDQIIALADIYQALTEDRPYRKGMEANRAIDIMLNMADNHYISKELLLDFKQLVFSM